VTFRFFAGMVPSLLHQLSWTSSTVLADFNRTAWEWDLLPSSYVCPRCNCGACYALHRKGFDWLMWMVGMRPARCLTCSKKFYARYVLNRQRMKPGVPKKASSSNRRAKAA